MAHLSQTKEKNCLNCETTVIGKYWHNCGQETIKPEESVWHFNAHFFNDVTHFDDKYFTMLKDLLLKQGFLLFSFTFSFIIMFHFAFFAMVSIFKVQTFCYESTCRFQ